MHKKQEVEELAFKTYISDSLMAIANNTTHFFTLKDGIIDYGTRLNKRFIEYFNLENETELEREEENKDLRSADEIASDMWNRIRGN